MICAPRGISSTNSARVARTIRNVSPRVVRTGRPSEVAMRSSCSSFPPRRSATAPARSTSRYRRSFRSIRRRGSPSLRGPDLMTDLRDTSNLGLYAVGFDVLAHPAHDGIQRCSGEKDLAHAGGPQRGNVLLGDDPAGEDHDLAATFLPQQVQQAGQQRHVRAREDGESDGVGIFLNRGIRDHLRGLVQSRVDDLEPGVAQRTRHDLRAPVVPIQAGLGHNDTNLPIRHRYHLTTVPRNQGDRGTMRASLLSLHGPLVPWSPGRAVQMIAGSLYSP